MFCPDVTCVVAWVLNTKQHSKHSHNKRVVLHEAHVSFSEAPVAVLKGNRKKEVVQALLTVLVYFSPFLVLFVKNLRLKVAETQW